MIDPMMPSERPASFQPEPAILTCRHHRRDSWKFGCAAWVVEQGCALPIGGYSTSSSSTTCCSLTAIR
ncbi:MAG TPA: hypothetical protein VKO84_05535 [Gaiellaceae bacterium]|nr:hypothetical protein [Gaiellaceae bacterium]